MITETQIVDILERDLRANRYGYRLDKAHAHAKTFGEDTKKLIMHNFDLDSIRLQSRCGFRCARLCVEVTEND